MACGSRYSGDVVVGSSAAHGEQEPMNLHTKPGPERSRISLEVACAVQKEEGVTQSWRYTDLRSVARP